MWAETRGKVHTFVHRFVEPFLAAHHHAGITLERNDDGFPTFFLPSHTSTYEVCVFLAGRAQRAKQTCDSRNTRRRSVFTDDGDGDANDSSEGYSNVGHQFMGPLAVAAYMLMTAADTISSVSSESDTISSASSVDPFDGHSLPDAWSGIPLFSGPTTLIAHQDHSRFLHLGFETNTPSYGDWKPELVNARMELFKSNWMIQSLRFSTLVAILVSTRPLCKKWLKTLVDIGLVSDGIHALDSDLDISSLSNHFAKNGVSKLEVGWDRSRS